MAEDMNWIETLLDEYPTKRTDTAILRMMAAYSTEHLFMMQRAVVEFMKDGNKFFPKVADLAKYVEKVNSPDYFTDWLAKCKQSGNYQEYDNFMLQWELEQGTIGENND